MLQSYTISLLSSKCLKLGPEREVEAASFGQPRSFLKAVMRIVKSINCSVIFTINSYNLLCMNIRFVYQTSLI